MVWIQTMVGLELFVVGVTCASTRYYLDPVRPWSKLDPPDHGLVGAYIG